MNSYTDLSYLKNDDERIGYVLDTNVLLHDPSAIFRFEEHIVLISLLILEEIDAKKSDPGIGLMEKTVFYHLSAVLLPTIFQQN